MMKNIYLFVIILLCTSCSLEGPVFFEDSPTQNFSENLPTPPEINLERIEIQTEEVELFKGQIAKVNLIAFFDNGARFAHLTDELMTLYQDAPLPIIWFSNNTNIVMINKQGVMTGKNPGRTTLKVSLGKFSQLIDVTVIEIPTEEIEEELEEEPEEIEIEEEEILIPEEPNNPADVFLSDNDTITFTVGPNGGFNYNPLAPEPFEDIFGGPTSNTNVISLGNGGEIIIELADYHMIDGPGIDFIVFENPFTGWTERAQVSVSLDGATYFDYPCDAFDPGQVYEGCAGVTPVNYSSDSNDYLDPATAGGDQYDLADLGLDEAFFIKITDQQTCIFPALCVNPTSGFDFDGIAIINGINDF